MKERIRVLLLEGHTDEEIKNIVGGWWNIKGPDSPGINSEFKNEGKE